MRKELQIIIKGIVAALCGNLLTVLLYKGYECFAKSFQISVLGIQDTPELTFYNLGIFGLLSIVDAFLSIVCIIPAIAAFGIGTGIFLFTIYNVLNTEKLGMGRSFETVLAGIFSPIYLILIILSPIALAIVVKLIGNRIGVSASILVLIYNLLVIISIIIIVLCILFLSFSITSIIGPIIGDKLFLICGSIIFIGALYSLYTYGEANAITYGNDTGAIKCLFNLFKDIIIEKGAELILHC